MVERRIVKLVVGKIFLTLLFFPSFAMGFEAGYSKGFFLKEGKDYVLKVRIRGQVQGFYESKEKDGKREERSGFLIRRARLLFSGNVFSESLKYELQITLEDKAVSLRDLFVEYPLLKDFVIIRAGQFKVPFNREFITSSANLELVDRSMVNKYFSIGRDIGVAFTGSSFDHLHYALGIFSGEGMNQKPVDSKFLFSLRMVVFSEENPEKIWKASQGAFEKKLLWSVGVGGIYGDGLNLKKLEEEGRKDLPEFLKPITTHSSAYFSKITGDLAIKLNPFSFEGEVNYGRASDERDAIGGRVQTGFFITKRLQSAFRYSFVKETEWNGEYTVGFSWFLSKHEVKLQTDYTYSTEKDASLIRLQFQFYL